MAVTDKAKNAAQTTKGSAKEFAGRVKGDKSLEAEGSTDKLVGNLKQAGEKVKDAGEKVKDAFTK
jgi:uncharacterized protein YjbJ (UPF0337 family)